MTKYFFIVFFILIIGVVFIIIYLNQSVPILDESGNKTGYFKSSKGQFFYRHFLQTDGLDFSIPKEDLFLSPSPSKYTFFSLLLEGNKAPFLETDQGYFFRQFHLPFNPKVEPVIKETESYLQTQEKIYLIYDNRLMESNPVDPKSFKILDERSDEYSSFRNAKGPFRYFSYVKDKDGVYYFGLNHIGKIENVNPDRFEKMTTKFWTDGEHIIQEGEILKYVELKTFSTFREEPWNEELKVYFEAQDSKAYFAGGKRFEKKPGS